MLSPLHSLCSIHLPAKQFESSLIISFHPTRSLSLTSSSPSGLLLRSLITRRDYNQHFERGFVNYCLPGSTNVCPNSQVSSLYITLVTLQTSSPDHSVVLVFCFPHSLHPHFLRSSPHKFHLPPSSPPSFDILVHHQSLTHKWGDRSCSVLVSASPLLPLPGSWSILLLAKILQSCWLSVPVVLIAALLSIVSIFLSFSLL